MKSFVQSSLLTMGSTTRSSSVHVLAVGSSTDAPWSFSTPVELWESKDGVSFSLCGVVDAPGPEGDVCRLTEVADDTTDSSSFTTFGLKKPFSVFWPLFDVVGGAVMDDFDRFKGAVDEG